MTDNSASKEWSEMDFDVNHFFSRLKSKYGGYEVKGHRHIRSRSNHPSVSLSNLAGADVKYEPASFATKGAGLQTGDQGQDGLHWLPEWQDQERD